MHGTVYFKYTILTRCDTLQFDTFDEIEQTTASCNLAVI